MNPQETASSSTETPPARNVGSIPITRSPSQKATPAGKPGKSQSPAWFEKAHNEAVQKDLEDHDTAWESKFVLPLADFMKQRGVQHLRVDLSCDTVKYALIPLNEPVQIFELVDATDEERYYPLGVFFDINTALIEAQKHHPALWEPIMDQLAFAEVRARKVGTSGGDYAVLWRGEWFYDYEATEWKLVEQQTGTLEKPLPITRA